MSARAIAACALACVVACVLACVVACGGAKGRDARYPARPDGCAVRSFAGEPTIVVDDLGMVEVDCGGSSKCARKLLDEVCRAGGDVVWGLGENPVASSADTKMRGHAAHSANRRFAPRARGCDVKVHADAPKVQTENIGPVSATCAVDLADADCTRELQDQTCELGGDVVWGVAAPVVAGNKKVISGRAAHTR
jgi:hypothetical protein